MQMRQLFSAGDAGDAHVIRFSFFRDYGAEVLTWNRGKNSNITREIWYPGSRMAPKSYNFAPRSAA